MRLIAHLLPLAAMTTAAAFQSSETTDWQTAAGGKKTFEISSVKPTTQFRLPNFPLNTGNAKPPGGRFLATFPLWVYIQFAYKLPPNDAQVKAALAQAPKWINDNTFEIDARAEGNPTKDQMRLMMQSLLADRFKLKVHFEMREVAVFALTLVNPGKPGPKLRPHNEGPPCPDYTGPKIGVPRSAGDAFPPDCDTDASSRQGGDHLVGYRNATMPLIADTIYSYGFLAGEVDKPVVDRTRLAGKFDFTLVYSTGDNDLIARSRPNPPNPEAAPAVSQDAGFIRAVREQLGLRLESTKAPIRMLVIDHVEQPAAN